PWKHQAPAGLKAQAPAGLKNGGLRAWTAGGGAPAFQGRGELREKPRRAAPADAPGPPSH
ncbi:hypothetical protein PV338_25115, partial [Streptomyces scabiei]|uniref:hypothetical protein n=1 Tax=Streptomyces scabiei TaxID=1930 RepID=UPI0029A8AE3B